MLKDFNILRYNIAFFLRAMMLLYPILLLFYQQNGLSVQELFFFQGISYLVSIIAEVPVGFFSNNYSRKNLLIISFFMYLTVTLLWLFYTGYFIVLIGEILFGLSKIIMDNAMSGYLYDYLEKQNKQEKMVKYYGYLSCFLALGTAFAAILGVLIYSNYGTKAILTTEVIIIGVIIALIASMPGINKVKKECLLQNIRDYFRDLDLIINDEKLIYYILFSGILTSCSILFALSFQPMLQKSLLPIFMFGVVAFVNHFIRALSGCVAKFFKNVNLNNYLRILLLLYSLSFFLIICSFCLKNSIFTVLVIIMVCFIIGFQLIFTILHVSRLHKFVQIGNRGALMSVNNLFSRIITAGVLVSSKLFFDKYNFEKYYIILFILFFITYTYLILRLNKVKGQECQE